VKELGAHTWVFSDSLPSSCPFKLLHGHDPHSSLRLVCSALYNDADGERKYLPQFFKFVVANPLSVRTKVIILVNYVSAFLFVICFQSSLYACLIVAISDMQVRVVKVGSRISTSLCECFFRSFSFFPCTS